MRYHRGSRRVTVEHFGNLRPHEKMHSVVGDTRDAVSASLYSMGEAFNRWRPMHCSGDGKVVARS